MDLKGFYSLNKGKYLKTLKNAKIQAFFKLLFFNYLCKIKKFCRIMCIMSNCKHLAISIKPFYKLQVAIFQRFKKACIIAFKNDFYKARHTYIPIKK